MKIYRYEDIMIGKCIYNNTIYRRLLIWIG